MQTVTTVSGLKSHQDWFDENCKHISAVVHTKSKAYPHWQNKPSSVSKKDKFKYLQSKLQMKL